MRRGTGDRPGIAYSLEAFVALAVAQQQMERAARLFGAMELLHELIHFILSPAERAERERDLAATRAALGEEAFMAAYEEGKRMTLDETVEYALES